MDFYLRTPKNYNDPNQVNNTPFYFGDGTNDLQVDTNGDFSLIQGPANLDQGMAKILSTEQGANQFFDLYGSLLWGLIGTTTDLQTLNASVQGTVIDALTIYQFINQSNPNLDEQINTLESMNITDVSVNYIEVDLTVITMSGLRVGTTITAGNPS
jgi:phage baseplate assembly protein W